MRVGLVTSAQNPKIKHLLALQEKSRLRREEGVFVVEGRRELQHCIEGGFVIDTVFYCPSILGKGLNSGGSVSPKSMATLGRVRGRGPSPDGRGPAQQDDLGDTPPPEFLTVGNLSLGEECRLVEVPEELYRKIAYRESTEGVLAEVRARGLSLDDLDLGDNPLVVVLEGVEKPGNLGAVLRSADAAGASAVFICDPLTDLWNPNLIRASIGAVFTVPVVCCSSEEAIKYLKSHRLQILTAQLQDSSVYYDVDMTRGTAIVIGTESTGLSEEWRRTATSHILIPMLGRLDSLNASVSAAVLLYEAVRQRQHSCK